jgi:hypothetical protein
MIGVAGITIFEALLKHEIYGNISTLIPHLTNYQTSHEDRRYQNSDEMRTRIGGR